MYFISFIIYGKTCQNAAVNSFQFGNRSHPVDLNYIMPGFWLEGF